jgi:hypothetical protein
VPDDLEQYVQDHSYFQQRLNLARRATDLDPSMQFDLARSHLSDAELLEVTRQFGRDTTSSGWGFAPVLDHLLSREPERVPVADLQQLQANLKRQGYTSLDAEVTGTWDPSWSTAFYRWDQDNREQQMGGSSWGAAPVRAGLELLTNTMPTNVFRAIVGGARGFVEQAPETAERVGLLGGAVGGAALGAAAGTAFAPLTLGASVAVGAAVGGAVGFLADLFSSDEKEGDQGLAESFVDALSPFEEYGATRDGVKAFWEDVGWVLTASSFIGAGGLAAGAVRATAGEIGAASTVAAQEFGSASSAAVRQALIRGPVGEPGFFGRIVQHAAKAATSPEFGEELIRSSRVAIKYANRAFTPFSAASMGARYAGGLGSGETQTTIEKGIEEGPQLPGWVDLASFVIAPQQFFPFKLSQLGKAAERVMGETTLLPFIHAVQQSERIGFDAAKPKALAYLGTNDIERATSAARLTLEAGLDTFAREKVAMAGLTGVESNIEHVLESAKAAMQADYHAADEAGKTKIVQDILSRVTGENRANLEGWLIRNATKGSGLEKMGDFLEATKLGERVTADIRAGRIAEDAIEFGGGRIPNSAEAWNRLEGQATIQRLLADEKLLKRQSARARNPQELTELVAARKQVQDRIKELQENLPAAVTEEVRGIESLTIAPAKLDTLTGADLRGYAKQYRDLRKEVVEADKAAESAGRLQTWTGQNVPIPAEVDARMRLYRLVDDLERRHVLPEKVVAAAKADRPSLSVAKHIEDRGKFAAGEVKLPTDVMAEFERLGYKPVAVGGGFFNLAEAQQVANTMGALVYGKVSRWVETFGLSPLKQNDDAIWGAIRASQEYEVDRVVRGIAEKDRVLPGIEGLTGSEVLSKLQRVITEEKGAGASVGGLSIGKAPLVDVRQLSPQRILEVFESDFPGFTLQKAEEVFKALKRGSAFGSDVKILHPADAMRAIGRAMRVNSLPGFSDVVRAYTLPSKGKLILGGVAAGAATGAIVGDEDIWDAVKGAGAGLGAGLALAMAAFAKNGYGYLPDRLARLHGALRYSLSPTFDAGRYLEQNMIAAAKHGLPPMLKPRAYITKRYGGEGWNEALALWDQVNGTKGLFKNVDDLDRRMNQVGVLAFSPRNFEAAQAYLLAQRGMAPAKIKEAVYGIGRYGLGRTGLEKSVNFVFFPFSYQKKMLGVAGDFVLQHPALRLLLHEGMRMYYTGKFDEKLHSLIEDHAPILGQLQRISNFGYGISPGRFFLEGLADNKSNLGKVSQTLASFFVPSGAAQPVARVAGEAGDLAMHLFVPIVATGADIKRIGGVEQLQATLESYLPLYRDIFGPSGIYEQAKDQVTAITQGEGKWAQARDYQDEVRLAKSDLEDLAEALGYASAEGLMNANPAFRAQYETTRQELAKKYPTGFKEAQSFTNSEAINDQALYDIANKVDPSKAEELILKLRSVEAEGDTLVELGLPRDLVDAMTADSIRREALLHVRDREFAELYERFFSYRYGPIRSAA